MEFNRLRATLRWTDLPDPLRDSPITSRKKIEVPFQHSLPRVLTENKQMCVLLPPPPLSLSHTHTATLALVHSPLILPHSFISIYACNISHPTSPLTIKMQVHKRAHTGDVLVHQGGPRDRAEQVLPPPRVPRAPRGAPAGVGGPAARRLSAEVGAQRQAARGRGRPAREARQGQRGAHAQQGRVREAVRLQGHRSPRLRHAHLPAARRPRARAALRGWLRGGLFWAGFMSVSS